MTHERHPVVTDLEPEHVDLPYAGRFHDAFKEVIINVPLGLLSFLNVDREASEAKIKELVDAGEQPAAVIDQFAKQVQEQIYGKFCDGAIREGRLELSVEDIINDEGHKVGIFKLAGICCSDAQLGNLMKGLRDVSIGIAQSLLDEQQAKFAKIADELETLKEQFAIYKEAHP